MELKIKLPAVEESYDRRARKKKTRESSKKNGFGSLKEERVGY